MEPPPRTLTVAPNVDGILAELSRPKIRDTCFTWCPIPAFHSGSSEQQLQETLPIVQKLAKCTSDCVIYPELTLQGNIHYHALFKITDKVKWFKSVLPTFKRNGFVKVVACNENHKDKWLSYIRKEAEVMIPILSLTEEQFTKEKGLNLTFKKPVPKGSIGLQGHTIYDDLLCNDQTQKEVHVYDNNHLTIYV